MEINSWRLEAACVCDYIQGFVLKWFGFYIPLIFLCPGCNSSLLSWPCWSMQKNAAIAIWHLAIPRVRWLVADHIDVGGSAVRAVSVQIYSCAVCSARAQSSLMPLYEGVQMPAPCTTSWHTWKFTKGRVQYSSVKLKGVLIAIENSLMIVLRESVCRNSALIFGVLASEITSKWLAFMIAPTFLWHPSYPLLPRYWKPVMFEEVKEKRVEQLQKALALQPSTSKEKSCSVITKLKALHLCMSCVPQLWIEAGTEPEVFSLLWMKTSSCLSQQVSNGFSLDVLKCL